ncbi:MAG: alkaline phosphatase family protein [Terriglobia bacterium]
MTKRTFEIAAARQVLSALVLALALAALVLAAPQSPRSGHTRHVLVISVDGMRSEAYTNPPPGAKIPNLLQLKSEGSYADAVVGVYPTSTYPSHTTLVTGCLPAQHGIFTNLSSRVAGKSAQDWFWFAKAIKCPTLWDEAAAHHLTVASVAWPVTAGANIDWDVPEIWNPAEGMVADPLYVAKFMNPVFGLQLLGALGPPQPNGDSDVLRSRIATYVIETHKPDLTLVHMVDLDAIQHRRGPRSPAVAATLTQIDGHIGELLSALHSAAIARDTDVFVVSDHGFLPVERLINPNVLLVGAGLLTADANGNITGGKIDTVANGGSFFIYWPASENLRPEIGRALKPLFDRGLAWAVLDRQALKNLGADPGAQMALDAPTGAMYGETGRGELVSGASGGDHGYLPFRKGLAASFIAWGPDIRPGVDVHRIRMIRVAPTILRAMGISDPKFGEAPALGEIWRQ